MKTRIRNEVKIRANTIAQTAMRKGTLTPKPCEKCGLVTTSPHKHHEDYDKPLEVNWLCKSCHSKFHALSSRDRRDGYKKWVNADKVVTP